MNKKVLLTFLLCTAAFASNPKAVFEKNCASCHTLATSKQETLACIDKMKAPSMLEVMNRLRENISVKSGDEDQQRAVIVGFIQEYVKYPDLMKSFCSSFALDKFGVMPPVKKIKERDLHNVAEWLYDSTKGKKFE